MNVAMDKGAALLAFLQASATLRRKRIASYGTGDKVVWFCDVPRERLECRSPFLADKPEEPGELWLEVRKKRMPTRPPVPGTVADWVRPDELDQPEAEPELRPEITVVVEQQVPHPDAPPDRRRTVAVTRRELRRLADHAEVADAWLEYLLNKWEPWAKEMSRWQDGQRVYEHLDFMRRRLEDSEERYELLLAVGLLQWRDPTGTEVKRHLLTAPAEITLDAASGLLTVVPAASFDGFRVELDMLELKHQPRLNGATIQDQLDELDIQAWDTARVAPVLRGIANCLSAGAQVAEDAFKPADRAEERPRLAYAPAIVLRERRPTAYDDLVRKFLETANGSGLEATKPWSRLLLEGVAPAAGSSEPRSGGDDDGSRPVSLDRFLFPLATNDEQRQIVHRLRAEPCVLVKGPPGTGKSHTIANLICHLLAMGDRVLVTAHAPKALAVLRDLLPREIRDLSVTTLGSSREDQRLLEESVRGILRRTNEWEGSEHARRAIDQAEKRLQELEGALAKVERDLRESREADSYPHTLSGGYQGTAAQIAKALQEQREEFGWFPDGCCAEGPFPLDSSEAAFLAETHAQLTRETLEELRMEAGDVQLLDPDRFRELIAGLMAAEESAGRAARTAAAEKVEALSQSPPDRLHELRGALEALEDLALRAARVLGDLTETILADLLAGSGERWSRLASAAEVLLSSTTGLLGQLGATSVELPTDIHQDRLRADAQRRLAHFEQGGRRGFSIFSPRVVKETRYLIELCRIDGQKPNSVEQLKCVVRRLELERNNEELRQLWTAALPELASPRQAASGAEDLTNELRRLLHFFQSKHAASLTGLLLRERTSLSSPSERREWLKAVAAESAGWDARNARKHLDEILETICRCQNSAISHPCLAALAEALKARDVSSWCAAWEERERVREQKSRLGRYNVLLERLDRSSPVLGELLRTTAGNPEWKSRVLTIERAWVWSSTRTWLRRVSDASAYTERVHEFHRLQQKIEKATEELVSRRAWRAFFQRLDDATRQSLIAWTRAVDRIGKGTGKHAYRHRRAARKYLMDCVSRIPAWVMPLHKLWDTVDAASGLFDTVIVDEASQASTDSLVLLLLAKRVIVVGDDKQNSPEAVGVLQDDIDRLAREHLNQFKFRDEFRPDTSLFDHAERAFGSLITLREHFRCVPEIIRFSNDLCYRDAPLIPLRQAPPNRLPPTRWKFIAEGACEGEGQRICNRAEAEALVEVIESLVADDAYEGKSMGVIALQGHAQAELIESLLAKRLDPKTIEERRLRCGEPATFQGDQRDVIFLSLVIDPNVHHRALARLPDQRRFNVAMSRARDQVWLFHSVQQHDLGPEDLRHKLLSFFRNPGHGALDTLSEDLDHLERKARSPRRLGNQPEPYGSWFEIDVALELLRRKFAVRPQVEVAGKFIDLVVDGIGAQLAVECDGDEWHGAEQYDRDMARQRQLERAGWTFVRVRESDFHTDRETAVRAVTDACQELGIHPLDFIEEGPCIPIAEEAHDEERAGGSPGAESRVGQAPEGEEEPAEAEVSVAACGPFTGYGKELGFPDPRDSSPANVRAVLRQIIEKDGPLTRSSVFRLYVEGCPGLQRVAKPARQALNRALGAMLRAGDILQDDELHDGSPDGQVLRLAGAGKVQVRPAGRRDLLEIPPSELRAVIERLPAKGSGISDDDDMLLRGLLDHYGLDRLTRRRKDHLSKVLQLMRSTAEKLECLAPEESTRLANSPLQRPSLF